MRFGSGKYLNCRAGLVCSLRIQRLCLHRNIKIPHDPGVSRFCSASGLRELLDRSEWNSYEGLFADLLMLLIMQLCAEFDA